MNLIVFIFLCLCFMCVSMHVCACKCTHLCVVPVLCACEATLSSSILSTLFLGVRISYWIWGVLIQQELAIKLEYMPAFLCRCWGSELRESTLLSGPFQPKGHPF